jgi:threonine/homoserine/homoserine lactone efflux protein
MGEAIGQTLPFAVAVALSPFPIIAVVLILSTPRARTTGPAYVIGSFAGLVAIGAVVLGLAGPSNASDDGGPATWVSIVKIVLGAFLVLFAWKQWRGRPREGDHLAQPKWMDAIGDFTPVKATGAGFLLASIANPKNLVLAVGAAATIAQTGIAGGEQAIAYGVFALMGTIGVAAPVVVYFAMGDRSTQVLDGMKTWMSRHNAAIMSVLCLVIGAKLIGDAISGLSA